MTRKQLEELGLSKEQTDKVMEINGGDICRMEENAGRSGGNIREAVEK